MKCLHGQSLIKSYRGFTRIELILVSAAVTVVLALLFPAVSPVRMTARKLECANSLKRLAIATINYATERNGELPYLADKPPGLCDPSLVGPHQIPERVSFHIPLFPYLDNAGAIEYIETQKHAGKANEALLTVLGFHYRAMACPADTNHWRKPGGISYVANCGYGEFVVDGKTIKSIDSKPHSASRYNAWDLNSANGVSAMDKLVARSTGVFWLPDKDGWKSNLQNIGNCDGTGQTIMYSENLNAGTLVNAGRDVLNAGFVVGRTSINFTNIAPRYLASSGVAAPFPFHINSNQGKSIGKYPVPSSLHESGVNVVYCDGHYAFLSEALDPKVYVRLMSPNGAKYGELKLEEVAF